MHRSVPKRGGRRGGEGRETESEVPQGIPQRWLVAPRACGLSLKKVDRPETGARDLGVAENMAVRMSRGGARGRLTGWLVPRTLASSLSRKCKVRAKSRGCVEQHLMSFLEKRLLQMFREACRVSVSLKT